VVSCQVAKAGDDVGSSRNYGRRVSPVDAAAAIAASDRGGVGGESLRLRKQSPAKQALAFLPAGSSGSSRYGST